VEDEKTSARRAIAAIAVGAASAPGRLILADVEVTKITS